MILEELKTKIVASLKLSQAEFSYPPRSEMGDLSLACFSLAKERAQDPAALAAQLAKELDSVSDWKKYFSAVKPIGPYLNFFIAPEYLAERVIGEIKRRGKEYGRNKVGAGQTVMLEYSNGNTHKEYHVGHLRNIAYGDAVGRLLAAGGHEVVPVSYLNDFGIHVAKTIWEWRRNPDYQSRPEAKGYLLGQCYAAASQALKDQPAALEEVSRIMKQIESRSGDNYELWQETRRWSLDYFAAIYRELGVKFRTTFYESEVIAAGWRLVDDFLARGIFKKSQGAVIADLSEYNLGVLPIIRSDGTALYPVADLALAGEKFRRYPLDESIYIVDVRQSLYFRQLFKILELAGDRRTRRQLAYDFVTLPEGMMSSRTGNIISYQDLRDRAVAKFTNETKERHPDWSRTKINKTAKILALATMKFEMLKVAPEKMIVFNLEEAARFEGYTACYLEYGYIRLRSILRKRGWRFWLESFDPGELKEPKEKELLLKLAKYPKALWLARENYNPSEVSKYLFELVQLANDYYHATNILKAVPKTRRARLALIESVSRVLANGFEILGLESLEEM